MSKPKSPDFSQKVIKLALLIPSGRVTTYGLITAAAGGHPMLSRMITSILGKSTQANYIPFHRIVYSNGKVWLDPKHPSIRKKLYRQEGVKLDKNNKIIDFSTKIFVPKL